MVTLKERLTSMQGLDQQGVEMLSGHFVRSRFRKGQILTVPGQQLHEIHFIENGFLRAYFSENESEETLSVQDGGTFLVPSGRFCNQSNDHYIEMLTEVSAYTLSVGYGFDRGVTYELALKNLLLQIYDENLLAAEKLARIGHIQDGNARYQKFKKEFPHVIGQVSNQVMASLLRMSLKHFVRLKTNDL